MNRRWLFGGIFLCLALLIVLTPGGLLPICPLKADGGYMKCHWMGQAVRGCGALGASIALFFMFVRNRAVAYGLALANLPLALLIFALAFRLIGGCKMHTMSCNLYVRPAVYLLSLLYFLISAFYLLRYRADGGAA